MQLSIPTDQGLNQTNFLKAIETQNYQRAKAIWKAIKDQPDAHQAALTFLNTITDHEKVEWILNEVIVHSPVRSGHNITLSQMHLFSRMATEDIGGYIGLEKVMIQLGRNYFEPDFCFFRPAVSRRFKANRTIFPVPDFIVEVLSPSTRERDMGVKRELYCKYGVKEYWMVDAEAQIVYQNILKGKVYEAVIYTSGMELRSRVIRRLKLPVAALFDSSHPFKTWVSVAIHKEVEVALEASIELLAEKDKTIEEKDKALENKDKTIEEQGKTIEEKDKALENKDKTIKDKDKALQDKDKIIEELRRQLDDKP